MEKCIYHYCSVSAFKAIIQSSTIRLTNIAQSNDKDEIVNAIDKYCDILNKALLAFSCRIYENKTNIDIEALESWICNVQIGEMVNNAIENQSLIYYVACFSEFRDLLSQWRGYGNDGEGMAIGFDSDVLESITLPCVLKFDRVQYGWSGETSKISAKIDNEFEKLLRMRKTTLCDLENAVFKVINLMVYNAVFSKKEAFVEEGEWRLVFYPFGSIRNLQAPYYGSTFLRDCNFYDRMYDVGTTPLDIRGAKIDCMDFYERKGNIISYFNFNFSRIKRELIREIIVGPKSKLNETDLKLFLALNDFDMSNLRIYKSALGYK